MRGEPVMSNAPFNVTHLRYRYADARRANQLPLRASIDDGLFHHDDTEAILDVINEVANQLGLDAPRWCHLMEETLRHELRSARRREDILCGLHVRVAAQHFQEDNGPDLHR